MDFNLGYSTRDILILGAGASKEYGLPVWRDLAEIVGEEIKNDKDGKYKFHAEVLEWMGKVGPEKDKEYKTIDECITRESIKKAYKTTGHLIEDQIFLIFKKIFDEKYVPNPEGWISDLNNKILQGVLVPENINFINFNYDEVLERNFLDFDDLSDKEKIWLNSSTLKRLSGLNIDTLYPHGSVYSNKGRSFKSQIRRMQQTMKSSTPNYVDAVSCFEKQQHTVDAYHTDDISLHILGLGDGLKTNLNNLTFEVDISTINITVTDQQRDDEVIKYLSTQFGVSPAEVHVYRSCKELVAGNFLAF